jgi:hypothetical protein
MTDTEKLQAAMTAVDRDIANAAQAPAKPQRFPAPALASGPRSIMECLRAIDQRLAKIERLLGD